MPVRLLLLAAVFLVPSAAHAATSAEVTTVLAALALILVVAKVSAHLAERLRQPAVLGELLAGILLGNLPLVGITAVAPIGHDPGVALLAELGVILLLFDVGLES